jgi:hypothetical protein
VLSKKLVFFSKTVEKLVEFTLEKHFFQKILRLFVKKITNFISKKITDHNPQNAIIFNMFGSKIA